MKVTLSGRAYSHYEWFASEIPNTANISGTFKLADEIRSYRKIAYFPYAWDWSKSFSTKVTYMSRVSFVIYLVYIYLWGKLAKHGSGDLCGSISATLKAEWPDKVWIYVIDTSGNHLSGIPVNLGGTVFRNQKMERIFFSYVGITLVSIFRLKMMGKNTVSALDVFKINKELGVRGMESTMKGIRKLESLGFVRVSQEEKFPRKYSITLTEKGERIARILDYSIELFRREIESLNIS